MVTIPEITEKPARLYAFMQGRLHSGTDLQSRRGLLARHVPGDPHGALLVSKADGIIAIELYSLDIDTPAFSCVLRQKVTDDDPAFAQEMIDRFIESPPVDSRRKLGLMKYLSKAEAIEMEAV